MSELSVCEFECYYFFFVSICHTFFLGYCLMYRRLSWECFLCVVEVCCIAAGNNIHTEIVAMDTDLRSLYL